MSRLIPLPVIMMLLGFSCVPLALSMGIDAEPDQQHIAVYVEPPRETGGTIRVEARGQRFEWWTDHTLIVESIENPGPDERWRGYFETPYSYGCVDYRVSYDELGVCRGVCWESYPCPVGCPSQCALPGGCQLIRASPVSGELASDDPGSSQPTPCNPSLPPRIPIAQVPEPAVTVGIAVGVITLILLAQRGRRLAHRT